MFQKGDDNKAGVHGEQGDLSCSYTHGIIELQFDRNVDGPHGLL